MSILIFNCHISHGFRQRRSSDKLSRNVARNKNQQNLRGWKMPGFGNETLKSIRFTTTRALSIERGDNASPSSTKSVWNLAIENEDCALANEGFVRNLRKWSQQSKTLFVLYHLHPLLLWQQRDADFCKLIEYHAIAFSFVFTVIVAFGFGIVLFLVTKLCGRSALL